MITVKTKLLTKRFTAKFDKIEDAFNTVIDEK
jgi:hypothetical protein